MFDDVKIPKLIERSPIKEANIEIRLSAKIPLGTEYGILYPVLKDFFENLPESLPSFPEQNRIKEFDPNLRYLPTHRIQKGNVGLAFGNRSLIFRHIAPYTSWKEWSDFFYPVIDKVFKNTQYSEVSVERLGIRYIDFMENSDFSDTTLSFSICDSLILRNRSQFRTVFNENSDSVILSVSNPTEPVKGLAVDLDFVRSFDLISSDNFLKVCRDSLDEAHIKIKKYFFGLLKPEIIESLNPSWN